MRYFKVANGDVFAYDDEQIDVGLADDKVAMTAAEVEAHLHPTPTEEQLREQWKARRAEAVANIKVTTGAGNVFDGDEISQGRMARAVLALQTATGQTVSWVLADNTVIEATAAELLEALALAGAEQARLWTAEEF